MTMAIEGGEWSAACPGHTFPGKDPLPIVREAGWAPGPVWMGGKSRPTGIWSLDRPARSQLLYRLSYRAHFVGTGTGGYYAWCKVAGAWCCCVPPSAAVIMFSWSCTPLPPTHHHKFILYLVWFLQYSFSWLVFTVVLDGCVLCEVWTEVFIWNLMFESVRCLSGELSLVVLGSSSFCSCNSGNGYSDIQGCDAVSLGERCPVFGKFKVSSSSGSRIFLGCLILERWRYCDPSKRLVPLTQTHNIASKRLELSERCCENLKSRW